MNSPSALDPAALLSRLRAAVNCAPLILFATDLSGRIVLSEGKALETMGHQPGQSTGTMAGASFPDQAWITQNIQRALAGESFSGRWQIGAIVLELTYAPFYDEQGQIAGAVGMALEVSERERADRAMQFLVEASRVLVESIDFDATLRQVARLCVPRLADWSTVVFLEEDNQIRRLAVEAADPSQAELAREIQANNTIDLRQPATHGTVKVLQTGESDLVPVVEEGFLDTVGAAPARVSLLRRIGPKSYLCVPLCGRGRVLGALTLVMAGSGRRFDRKDLELAEELGRRAGVAIDNARLFRDAQLAVQMRDDFLSIASHELNTPLTPLLVRLQRLQRSLPSGEGGGAQGEKVDLAIAQVRRLTRLVDNLLDVTRVSASRFDLKLERLDLVELTQAVAAQQESPLISVRSEGAVVGEWDRLRIEQILTNLLSNAVKYGGEQPIDVWIRCEDERALVSVRDLGIGIAPADQERIFRRFERAVPALSYGGLGLGLFIARQLAAAHHGTLSVESQLGEGATFTLSLPLSPGQRLLAPRG